MGTLRRATPADAEDLTRLRGLMHQAMGTPQLAAEWRTACEQAFRRRLVQDDFVAYGVEEDGRLVSCGAGWLEEHLPSPGQHDGRRGHIASMSTEPEWLRRGCARQVFGALLGWFAEQGVPRVDLRATDAGRPLYEAFGFRVLGGATMAWTAPGITPGMPGR
ncbi:MAG: GNAT family N-acetyltransferase [Actinobacteria bacterium]|nr:GNAT family N-acetyltransferase [Actinomycetota bacterium]